MRKLIVIITSLFIITGCGSTGLSKDETVRLYKGMYGGVYDVKIVDEYKGYYPEDEDNQIMVVSFTYYSRSDSTTKIGMNHIELLFDDELSTVLPTYSIDVEGVFNIFEEIKPQEVKTKDYLFVFPKSLKTDNLKLQVSDILYNTSTILDIIIED